VARAAPDIMGIGPVCEWRSHCSGPSAGAALTVKLLHELCRRGKKRGIVSMCIGGGMGAAGIFELNEEETIMEIKQAIMSRRSIRKYTSQPISDQDIQALLEAAVYAPSGKVKTSAWNSLRSMASSHRRIGKRK